MSADQEITKNYGVGMRDKNSRLPKVFFAIVLFNLSWTCKAQAPSAPAAGTSAAAPAQQDLSNWWRKSSLSYAKVPTQFLAHVDGTLSYSNSQGNTVGTTFNGKLDLSLRKERLTSRTTAWLQKQNVVYGFNAGSAHVTQDLMREQLNFDVTKHSSLIAGVEDYTFTLIFMNDRFTEYGGYGAELLKDKRQKLNMVGALGYSEFKFNRAGMLSIPSPIIHAKVLKLDTTPAGAGAMVMEAYNIELPRKMMINQTGSYMKFFDSYLGHQAMFNTNLDVPLSKHVGFTPGYQLIDQDNQIVDALGVKTEDRVLTLGLKLSW
jgi:hypothetical protein